MYTHTIYLHIIYYILFTELLYIIYLLDRLYRNFDSS